MQIAKPVFPQTQNFSILVPAVPAPREAWFAKARALIRWTFDIDDGVGGIVCFLCVLAVFGTLVTRLVQLDHSLNSQSLKCVTDTHSLQTSCEFE